MEERALLLRYKPECKKNVFFVKGNAIISEEVKEEKEDGTLTTVMKVRPLISGTEVEVHILCNDVKEIHKIVWD